MILENNRYNTI